MKKILHWFHITGLFVLSLNQYASFGASCCIKNSIIPTNNIELQVQNQPSVSLSVVGIMSIDEAINRLNNIAGYVQKEGPQLIVHSVNWYHYDPGDMTKTMAWNGISKEKDKIALTSKPLLGYYSCDDPQYMEWVLSFSKALGIDELNIDYEGGIDYPEEFSPYYQSRSWDKWFVDLLTRAEKYDLKISVMYEPKSIAGRLAVRQGGRGPLYTNDPSYPQEALKILKNDLKLICDKFSVKKDSSSRYVVNPVYKRVAGLPVIWVFWMTAGGLNEEIWKQALNELRAEGYVFVLVPNTYRKEQAAFDTITQGMNPWLDQLFTGFQSNYYELWVTAQKASVEGNINEARRISNQYIDEIVTKGLNIAAPVREVKGPSNFNITPLAIGFQDADVNAWGFRPAVYIEPYDRTHTQPGKLFRAYFTAAQNSKNQWYMICSGDDISERTHMLIPDEEYGFSGPYAIALVAGFLDKKPNLSQAIQITEEYIRQKNNGLIPKNILSICEEACQILPDQLKNEISILKK